MNKKILFGIIGAIVVASISVVALLSTQETTNSVSEISNNPSENMDSVTPSSSSVIPETVQNTKNKIEKEINQAVYFTVYNATTPSITIDKNSGSIYSVYFKESENQGGNLFAIRSDDDGKTFSEPIRVNENEGDVVLDAQWSAPGLAIGPNGEVNVVWYNADYSDPDKFPWGEITLLYSRSLDGGKTFESSKNPSPDDPRGEQSYPYVTVSDDNHVYISYLNLDYSKGKDDSGTPTVLKMVSSMDGGKTFEKSTITDHSACQCCATVNTIGPNNEVYSSSRSTFLNTVQPLINETRTDYQGSFDKIVIRDITVSHSTDSGLAKQFTDPVKVGNDKWFMNGCPDAGPGMAFDSRERLHIAWFTGSETAPDGQGFYYAYSDDKGASFNNPTPIHLLSEKWIPPTSQYVVTDNDDNAWIVFVNSEGMKKGPTYAEDYKYVGNGSIHLAVVDKNGDVIRNGPFAKGDITKHYPFTSSTGDKITISWIEGNDVKLSVINVS
ncbi:sialidase family protein [Nitrosopumilus sp.]|uniref:sialidase family protein n=1 Tax=Nitrosopumilus sp. TaxID=2024843 RepID=UPI0034A084A6